MSFLKALNLARKYGIASTRFDRSSPTVVMIVEEFSSLDITWDASPS
jgi:hypothetical protein